MTQPWRYNLDCLACEASLLCVSGYIVPGTVVILLAKDGDCEKYSVCLNYNLEDMHRGELPKESRDRAPVIVFGTCPRLSKIYQHMKSSGAYFQRLQGQPMSSPMEVMR